MSDVFISYSRNDVDVVDEFVSCLEGERISVWIDRDGILSGDAFKKVILKAIKDSSVVLFFSSKDSNQSDWTVKEIGVAVKYKKWIIPILLDDSNFNEEVEFDLINLDYIDYQDVSKRAILMQNLLKTVKLKIPNFVDSKQETIKSVDGYEYVDLDLPSGILWATCNVGANKPEDYGNYYSWDDGKTAAASWGNGWQMPSKEQWEELMQNTKNIWTTRNGVVGRSFKASNGNSLFLPSAGYRWAKEMKSAGSHGYYWSSSFDLDQPRYASGFFFDSKCCRLDGSGRRRYGHTVRAIRIMHQD